MDADGGPSGWQLNRRHRLAHAGLEPQRAGLNGGLGLLSKGISASGIRMAYEGVDGAPRNGRAVHDLAHGQKSLAGSSLER